MMATAITLQEAIDSFVGQSDSVQCDGCMESLAQYLVHFSDLFQERGMFEEPESAEWENDLEEKMVDLLEGDLDPAADLGSLPLAALEADHLRDFLGWFLLWETSDAELIRGYVEVLQAFVHFVHARGWWPEGRYQQLLETLIELAPEAERAARLSRTLFHLVRSGLGMPPRARGKAFSRFVEGHARVVRIEEKGIYLNFDEQGGEIGPVVLPAAVLEMVALGDVFSVELGLRGDSWVLLDVGPIYPPSVYVEVEEYQGLEKLF